MAAAAAATHWDANAGDDAHEEFHDAYAHAYEYDHQHHARQHHGHDLEHQQSPLRSHPPDHPSRPPPPQPHPPPEHHQTHSNIIIPSSSLPPSHPTNTPETPSRRRRGSFTSLFRRNTNTSHSGDTTAAAPRRSTSHGAYPPPSYIAHDPFPADSAQRIARSSHDRRHLPQGSVHSTTSSILHSGNRLRKNSLGVGSTTHANGTPTAAVAVTNGAVNQTQTFVIPIQPVSKTDTNKEKMLRKSSRKQRELLLEQERLAREAHANRAAPHISLNPISGISSFAGEISNEHYDERYLQQQDTSAASTNFSRPQAVTSPKPAPVTAPSPPTNGEYVFDNAGRTESMRNRGRYSYASSIAQSNITSPRRVRRRKDPTPFNILVIGAKHSGKTSFISFLRHSLALPAHKHHTADPPEAQTSTSENFTSHYLESEIDGERVGLTIWDSVGLEKNIVDLQIREMTAFVEAKFEDTFVEEQKVMRSPGVRDTHIHCVFLVLDPVRLDNTLNASRAGGGKDALTLDNDLDLQVMRSLWGKTTVIPVIAKADTLTTAHMAYLKRKVWQSLKKSKLDPLEALELEPDSDEDDEDDINNLDSSDNDEYADAVSALQQPSLRSKKSASHKRHSSLSALHTDDDLPYLPMSILSPDPYDLPPYAKPTNGKLGRRFPWGFADPYDPNHCDFGRLRDSIFSEWRSELRELSAAKWYENWRTSRLKHVSGASRQRVRGGVTPMSVVPREGRSTSGHTPVAAGVPAGVASNANRVNSPPMQAAVLAPPTASATASRVSSSHGAPPYPPPTTAPPPVPTAVSPLIVAGGGPGGAGGGGGSQSRSNSQHRSAMAYHPAPATSVAAPPVGPPPPVPPMPVQVQMQGQGQGDGSVPRGMVMQQGQQQQYVSVSNGPGVGPGGVQQV